jgi:hypothetical protein
VLTDPGSGAADREARREYLIDIDEAWELFRDAVERARSAYDEALEACGAEHVRRQSAASAGHNEALDKAWATYKQDVGDRRADRRAAARATYNEAAARCRREFDESMAAARDEYVECVQAARLAYEGGFDQAFAVHREAIGSVPGFLGPAEAEGAGAEDDGDAVAIEVFHLELSEAGQVDADTDAEAAFGSVPDDVAEAIKDIEQRAEEVDADTDADEEVEEGARDGDR